MNILSIFLFIVISPFIVESVSFGHDIDESISKLINGLSHQSTTDGFTTRPTPGIARTSESTISTTTSLPKVTQGLNIHRPIVGQLNEVGQKDEETDQQTKVGQAEQPGQQNRIDQMKISGQQRINQQDQIGQARGQTRPQGGQQGQLGQQNQNGQQDQLGQGGQSRTQTGQQDQLGQQSQPYPQAGQQQVGQQDRPYQPQFQPPLLQQPRKHLNNPTLNLVNGTATGKRLLFNNLYSLPSISTNECHHFLGIPFAAPPIDQLRFKAPQPSPQWPGVLDATKYKPACMQDPKAIPMGGGSISEDCLHVNIFKPAISTSVPIVVWIHGGAFMMGSATTLNPSSVCRQVIVNTLTIVTVNYRLGAFGFPAHDTLPGADTNLGLRDIAQAVNWVKENAVALGSKEEQIVLVGHGAGAALVSHLLDSGLVSPATIKGAILMSGSGMAPWALTRYSWKSMAKLMKKFNCDSIDCMKKQDAAKVVEKSSRFWSPYVDNTTITSRESKKVNLKRSDHQPFPMIIGFTMQEGTALAVQKLAPINGRPLKEKITRSLVELTGEAQEVVERRYLYDRPLPITLFETIFDFIDTLSEAYSDALFKLPSITEATMRTQRQSSNVYVYAVRNDVPLPGNYLPGYKASYHGSDLDLFWTPYSRQSRVNLLGAFLQVILHQEENHRWRPWSPQSPVILQITPYGGQLVTFQPPDLHVYNQTYSYTNATTVRYSTSTVSWTASTQRKFTLVNATPFPISFRKKVFVPTATTTTMSTTEGTTSTTTESMASATPPGINEPNDSTGFPGDDGSGFSEHNKPDFPKPNKPGFSGVTESGFPESTESSSQGTSESSVPEATRPAAFTIFPVTTDENSTESSTTSDPRTATVTATSTWSSVEKEPNVTMDPSKEASPTKETSQSKEQSGSKESPQTSNGTSSWKGTSPRGNGSTEPNTVSATTGQQDSLVWVLLGLAVLFLFLFLVTVGGCAAWNRQSYHPHPNRRSRHQGAKVRNAQQRVPPPVAPLDSSGGSSPQTQPAHQQRSHKDTEGKHSTRRLNSHQTGGTNIITNAHRRPRQPPPGLPPLLGKETKRN